MVLIQWCSWFDDARQSNDGPVEIIACANIGPGPIAPMLTGLMVIMDDLGPVMAMVQ